MRSIKESSDVPGAAGAATVRAPGRRTMADYAAVALATCGVGFMPLAPGTWGSAVGVGVYVLIGWSAASVFAWLTKYGVEARQFEAFRTSFELLVIIAITLAGTWAATRCERLFRRKDPGIVVIDEVAGQLITFLFVPRDAGLWALVAGFFMFRLFDIWKPYPINRLEALESGLGVMADDVLAGAYAATVMSLLASIYLLL
ncbi:MAG TPA: phosphatidylglycerophosphatase A [Pyrinomonadaceae bacterium]|nr:phosphatidylglycerophosphatase A [Pyrinomonadaceae bacterium]